MNKITKIYLFVIKPLCKFAYFRKQKENIEMIQKIQTIISPFIITFIKKNFSTQTITILISILPSSNFFFYLILLTSIIFKKK